MQKMEGKQKTQRMQKGLSRKNSKNAKLTKFA